MKKFLEEIEKTYHKYLPNSKCKAVFSKNIYSSISVYCFLANDKTELFNGYWDNDMINIRFTIDTGKGEFDKDINVESELPDNLKLEANSKSYTIKPTEKYMAYGRRKVYFRKTVGNGDKIIKTLDKFFNKLYNQLQDDLEHDIIHDNHRKLLINKLSKGD